MLRSSLLGLACVLSGLYLGCTQDFDAFSPEAATGSGGGGTTSTSVSVTGTTSSTTTTTTTATTGSSGTTTGGGCTGDGDCDDTNPCTDDTCDLDTGTCDNASLPDGPTPGVADEPDDCVDAVCVDGEITTPPDDSETPAGDGNDCTVDACQDGDATYDPEDPGTSCAGGVCDGQGMCGGCVDPDDCPGMDDFCKTRTCDNGVCGVDFTAADTTLPGAQQTPDNCHTLRCDGMGNIEDQINDNDTPVSDNNQCTLEECDNGVPYPPDPPGSFCSGGVCDGMGTCVECVDDGDCTAPETCGGGGMPNVCG